MTIPKIRKSAAERIDEIVLAAVRAFAANGYAGATTDQVARLVGVSQPYVIRLFGTKQALFIAAFEHICDQLEDIFRKAATEGDTPQEKLTALGRAGYHDVLTNRDLLLVMLHGFAAAASDEQIGAVVRRRYGAIYTLAHELSGADVVEVRDFMATGALLNIMAVMRVVEPGSGQPWADEIMRTFEEDG